MKNLAESTHKDFKPYLRKYRDSNSEKLVIFDRDSTLVQDFGYTWKSEDLNLLPGVPDAFALLHSHNIGIAIATNQSGVSRNFFTIEQMNEFHDLLNNTLLCFSNGIDLIASCIHLPENNCACRKPKPGMLLSIMTELEVSPENSLFIGDKDSDRIAAEAAGVMFKFVTEMSLNQILLDWLKK